MLIRAWRAWRSKAKLIAPQLQPPVRYIGPDLLDTNLREIAEAGGPELKPYEGLAEFWHSYIYRVQPDYTAFLLGLARNRRLGLRSILDLACGSGTCTARLTGAAPQVVGLDMSEPMLARARIRCACFPEVEFIQGDFRNFELNRQFDASVCACDSLNYVASIAELAAVFRSVARHLRPGGVFVFDTITEFGMKVLTGKYHHIDADGGTFALQFTYDPDFRQEVSRAILPTGIEIHRRIPIDPTDVAEAISDTDLVMDDYFSDSLIPGRWHTDWRCYFVLSKQKEAARDGNRS